MRGLNSPIARRILCRVGSTGVPLPVSNWLSYYNNFHHLRVLPIVTASISSIDIIIDIIISRFIIIIMIILMMASIISWWLFLRGSFFSTLGVQIIIISSFIQTIFNKRQKYHSKLACEPYVKGKKLGTRQMEKKYYWLAMRRQKSLQDDSLSDGWQLVNAVYKIIFKTFTCVRKKKTRTLLHRPPWVKGGRGSFPRA